MKQIKNIKSTKKIIIFVVIFALLFSFIAIKTFADGNVYEINNFDELLEMAELSRQSGHQNDTYILKNDITITEEDQEKINNSSVKYLS